MSVFSMPEAIMPAVKSQAEFYDDMTKFMLHFNFPPESHDFTWFGAGEDVLDLSAPGAVAVAGTALMLAAAGQAAGAWAGLMDVALKGAAAAPENAPAAGERVAPAAIAAKEPAQRQASKSVKTVSSKGVSLAAPKASDSVMARIDAAGGREENANEFGKEPK